MSALSENAVYAEAMASLAKESPDGRRPHAERKHAREVRQALADVARPNAGDSKRREWHARDLFAQVHGEMLLRGLNVSTMCNVLWCGEQPLAEFTAERILIYAVQVFDGHKHIVPKGCNVSTFPPGSRRATVERVVAAIEKRMAARAKSLPVPVDETAVMREPGEPK